MNAIMNTAIMNTILHRCVKLKYDTLL